MNLPPLPPATLRTGAGWEDLFTTAQVEALRREAYNLAMEEAAKVCEDTETGDYQGNIHFYEATERCAAAIRALKGQP